MNPIHFKTGKVSSAFLRATAGIVSDATEEYFKDAMPVAYSIVQDSKRSASELRTTLKNTTQAVFPTIKQLKSQGGFKRIMRWYTQQADEYDNNSDPSSFDDPEINDEGMSQITEFEKGSNQISKAVVESTGKLAESQLEATANIISRIDQQTSIISAGFKRTNTLLENVLEVMTKNTATMIETMAAGFAADKREASANDKMISRGKFSLSDYKNIIKGNLEQSELGVAASMFPMLMQIAKDPKQAVGGLLTWGVNKVAPGMKKGLKALDEVINETIMDSLIRIGENRSSGGLKGFIGQLFGIDSRRKSADTSRPGLEVKSVPFDTITREATIHAIPGYLRKILVALGGPDEVYDYRSRSFKTRSAIKKEFHSSAASTGTLGQASSRVRGAIGNDDFSNMLYDLMITDLGSKAGDGRSREVISKLQDKRFAGQYMRELVKKYNLSSEQLKGVNTFAKNLSNASKGSGARDISNQVAKTNVNRNHRVNSYIDEANLFEVDLSDIQDSIDEDLDAIAASIGLSRKNKKSKGSSASVGHVKSGNLQGINYTNMALYEIYRRLNAGINVFQVGSKSIYTDKFKPLGDDYLSRPLGYKPKTMVSIVNSGNNIPQQISMPSAIDEGPNELMNQELEDGTTEDLSKGQRFLRWGKSKGKALGKAMFFGSPSDVKTIFKGMMMDVAGVASDSAKSGISKINSSFGDISGYLKHKMFGNEYLYQSDVDDQGNPVYKKVAKNEKGGIFGFIKDNVNDMFKDKKNSAKDWFKDVMTYFDYSGNDPEEKQIEGKRKKILAASVGAMAGFGILGGPFGLLAGAIAGNALSSTGIWKKMKEKLFGRDDESGKAKGLFTKAIDGIIDPIHYQMSKTMKTAAAALKNNILAPLGDIGRAIRDRAVYGAKHYFREFFNKVFDNKLAKGVRKVVSTVIGTPLKLLGSGTKWLGGKIGGGLLALPGVLARGAIKGGSGFIGGGLSGIAQHIAAGTDYGFDEDGNKISGRKMFKDRRAEEVAKNKRENEYNGLGSYKDWKKNRNKQRVERRKKFKDYTSEDVSIVTAEAAEEMAATTREISRGVDQITGEIIPGSSFKTHDQGLHDRLDNLLGKMKRGETDSIISGSIGLVGTGDEVSNDEEKLITAMAEESTKENANKSTIVSKFKNLLGINKKRSREEAEKKTSLFSSIVDGIGGLLKKGWPLILGGLMMLSSGFRDAMGEAITSFTTWAAEKLPVIIGGALNIGKEAFEGISAGADALATGSSVTKDEVTGERKNVLSAEKHSEKIQNGIFNSSVKDTFNVPGLLKDYAVQSLGRTAIRGIATVPQLVGGGMAATSAIGNVGVRTGQRLVSGATSIASGLRSGSGIKAALKEGGRALTSPLNTGSSMLDDATRAGVGIFKGASGAKELVTSFRKAFTSPAALGSIAGGLLADFSANISWNSTEYSKNSHIVGDYGFGNAGGFRMTNTTVKTATTASLGIAGGMALGATVKAAMAAAAAGAGAGPVGWVVACVAAIIAVSAAIASLVNYLTGIITDKSDEDYAIRSNSSKLHAVIGETFTYENGAENPMYVYAGRESDRTLGLTKGMNMRDPEIVFGRFMRQVKERLTSAPGCEMLLYDFINNMAVQGVPFACYVAGDSNKSKTGGAHANSGIIKEFEDTDKVNFVGAGLVGLVNIEYTQVKKSTVKKNKDKVFADIAANISRQDKSILWNEDDLVDLYNTCKNVVDQLKSEGIIKSNGKINTKLFKGSPNSGKNDAGWKSLDKLCRKNGAYFIMQSIAYINSKIECDDSGQQWMQYRIDDIKKLMEGLSDVFQKEKETAIKEMKESGMSDSEIKAVTESIESDPSGDQAQSASTLSVDDYSPSLSLKNTGIKPEDRADVTKEMRYLVAAYAYSHPEILQKWVQDHSEESNVSVDNQDKISNWKTAFNDKRKKAMLRNQMAAASLKFADFYGDLFHIIPKVDWDALYTPSSSGKEGPGSSFGAGIVLRGSTSKPGEGELSKLWDQGKIGEDESPEDIHNILFGSKSHGRGSESESAEAMGRSSPGIFGDIGFQIAKYPSAEGLNLFNPDNIISDNREVAINLVKSLSDPSVARNSGNNLLRSRVKAKRDTEGTGGPVDPNDLDMSASASSINDGGNPISEPYKITSSFGPRKSPHPGNHKGVDIVPRGDKRDNVEVGSRFNGTVIQVKSDVPDSDHAVKGSDGKFTYSGNNETGNMVTIKTDDGLVVKNMHLAAGSIPKNIKEGERISAGDKIGIMGNTGWSTGKHLHYQIEKNGVAIDPRGSLDQGSTISSFNSTGDSTYPADDSSYQSSYSDYSFGTSSESTTSGTGPLAEFISKLKDIGNNFLSTITGGLLGSSSSDSSEYGSSNFMFGGYGSMGNYNLATSSNSNWVNVVRTVKEAVAAQQPAYNQSGYITINVGGKSIKTRTDCTGIICSMLKLYGVVPDNYSNYSDGFLKDGAIPDGFDKAPWPGWDNLVEGDILVRSGHAEVFARNEGSKHLVYNGGSTNSLCSPGPTYTGHKEGYSIIWRCRETAGLSTDSIVNAAMNLGTAAVSAVNPGAAAIGNVAKAGYNAIKSSINGPDEVWKYLKMKGYTDAAAAGIMGCWEAEGHNTPFRVEGDYLKGYPGHDVVMQSPQSLDDYTTNFLFPRYTKINIKKQQYLGKDGHYYPGIGFAQWTGPRAFNLLEYARGKNADWRDGSTQLEFFNQEMDSRKLSPLLNSASSVDESTSLFAERYEGVTSGSGIEKRRTHAKSIYDKYHDTKVDDEYLATDGVGGPEIDSSSIASMKVIPSTTNRMSNQNATRRNTPMIVNASTTRAAGSRNMPTPGSESSIPHRDDINSEEILKALYLVLDELRNISGNTGDSSSLLASLNEKDFVDKGLRDSLNSIGKTNRTRSNRSYYPTNSSVKTISSMARP